MLSPLQNSEQLLKVSLTGIAVVHCSSQTAPKHVLQKLMQFCRTMSSNVGRVSESYQIAQLFKIVDIRTVNCHCVFRRPYRIVTYLGHDFLCQVLRPKDSDRLVLFLKGINLPRPDSWGTSMISSFLQQIITYNGDCDLH